MAPVPRRNFNDAVTKFWSFAAPAYNLPLLQQWVYRPAQDEVIELLRSHNSQRVADIACGTGILADRIQRELHPRQVYGVDMSEGMLAEAKERSSAVQWLRAPAEQLPFDDGTLDAVVSTSAFHFFDQPAALRDFHRVLVPGGLAVVATISPPELLSKFSVERLGPAHSPSPRAMRALFEGAGFTVGEQHRVDRPMWPQFASDLITIGVKE
ncbi:MAG TPA: methyltransferase domain-containing protein [Mycobacterium sp.]|nr:methyltransferase domain-containing protein [Mycobacterium sp.]